MPRRALRGALLATPRRRLVRPGTPMPALPVGAIAPVYVRWMLRPDPEVAVAERVRLGGSPVVWASLLEVLGAPPHSAERVGGGARPSGRGFDVVDVGGGTGGFAVPLAEL